VFTILEIFLKSWTENELTNRIDELLKLLKPISIIVCTRLQQLIELQFRTMRRLRVYFSQNLFFLALLLFCIYDMHDK